MNIILGYRCRLLTSFGNRYFAVRGKRIVWREIDHNKDEFRVGRSENPANVKKEFRETFEKMLTNLDEKDLIPPGKAIPDFSSFELKERMPLTDAMHDDNSETLPVKFFDPASEHILSSSKLKKEFLLQRAKCHETTGKYCIPECNFESYSDDDISMLLERDNYLMFVMQKTALKKHDEAKKIAKKQSALAKSIAPSPEHVIPAVGNVSKKSQALAVHRQMLLQQDELPLLLDMSFEHLMNDKCKKSTVMQIEHITKYSTNNLSPYPIVCVNMERSSYCYKSLEKRRVHGFPDGVLQVTNKGLLEVDGVMRENMIYLTPDAPSVMTEYDPTKAYIIGGLVDMGQTVQEKTTYTLAKKLGIQRLKFPLNKYLLWGNRAGRTELTLDVVFQVFNTFRTSNNWPRALMHIPKRFHRGLTEIGKMEAKNDPEILTWFSNIRDTRNHPVVRTKTSTADFLGYS